MHACLNVDEIVRLIACELVASRAKATAAALARCCNSFEDPVLDTLWETQDQLPPLLEPFPRDVWNEGGRTVSTPTTYISTPSLRIWFESLSKDSQQRQNGVVSGSTPGECEISSVVALRKSCPWGCSSSYGITPSASPCFRI